MNIINNNNLEYENIITVHDCFGTHPNNLMNLADIVKKEFIKNYADSDFLDKFHSVNLNMILTHNYTICKSKDNIRDCVKLGKIELIIPEKPRIGKLNIDDIKFSKHLIT